MASSNRAVVFEGTRDMRVESLDFPKLEMPNGKKAPHGVILRIVATNICGSDLHIYRGSFPVPQGMVMGHEMTGEVIEVGSDVEFLSEGDLVSVPFNVACGRCRNCRAGRTDVCETTNPAVSCGAYGFNLGDWQGGQAEYLFVPYADFQLLRFPDRDQAMEKIRDLALLSDILPTAFHGLMEAGAKPGSTVYIAGAGPAPGSFLHHRRRLLPGPPRPDEEQRLRDHRPQPGRSTDRPDRGHPRRAHGRLRGRLRRDRGPWHRPRG